jgi:lantibiotic modifying enzyme
MRETGLRQLFVKSPVLLRLIAVITRQWIETTRELVVRLHKDLLNIQLHILHQSTSKILVTRVDGELSDRHNSGRSVKLVYFSDGSRVLYKPRDVRLDSAWTRLINQLNNTGAPIPLRTAHVLVMDGYGWNEFIEHVDCRDQEEFDIFFQRAGAWLCLFHIFAGSDMHEQNIIANGSHPVPVDLEVLLQSLPSNKDIVDTLPDIQAAEMIGQQIMDSVTMTGLLPTYGWSPENTLIGSKVDPFVKTRKH